jgi:hypothetical protein
MSSITRLVALVAGAVLVAVASGTASAQNASPDDVARFLAGMQPSAGSPIAPLTRNPSWQRHAKWFDSNWATLDSRQLSKVRRWSEKHLKDRRNTLYYMFSGPDFLYANAFFPEASNYLMSGLEPVGAVPNVTERTIGSLGRIQQSIGTSLRLSFFITKHMREQLSGGDLAGTLPILYAYIARSGKTIRTVELINLDREGALHPSMGEVRNMVPGVKIVLATSNGPAQNLYYFRTDVSNSGVNASGFLKFAATLGNGNGLLKSASYLMHSGNFTQVRDFVLEHSQSVVQDDSGIPLASFRPDVWNFQPFGNYLGPIAIFPGRTQPRLGDLFRKPKALPLEFGIGYRHRINESNLLLAVRKQALKVAAPPALQSAAPPSQNADPVTTQSASPPERDVAIDDKLPTLPPSEALPPLRPSQ